MTPEPTARVAVEEACSQRWRKDPERAAIETRDIDLESAADPAGCRHRVLSGPAISPQGFYLRGLAFF